MQQLAGGVARHRVGGKAVEAVGGLPGLGAEACKLEFHWQTAASVTLNQLDVGVDAVREGSQDGEGIRTIAGVFGSKIAAIAQASRLGIALDCPRTEYFREPPLACPLPELHLEQPVLRGHKALCEKQVMLV